MGLFGNSKVTGTSQFEAYLIEDEQIESVFRLLLDDICFTNKRILFFDKEVLSTKKQLINLPYRSIYYFSVEKGGLFELDNDIKLYTKGATFKITFEKGTAILEVEKLLAKYVCT